MESLREINGPGTLGTDHSTHQPREIAAKSAQNKKEANT
jgi:hypothetical protein